MGKKAAFEPTALRKKSKRKLMHPEIATNKEEAIEVEQAQKVTFHRRDMEEDSEEEVQLEVLDHESKDVDRLSEIVHKLLNKNVANNLVRK